MDNLNVYTDEQEWRWYSESPTDFSEAFVSVTTVLSKAVANPGLTRWFQKTSKEDIEKTRTRTAQFGTDAHRYFEKVLRHETFEVAPEHRPHVTSFSDWVAAEELSALYIEKPVSSSRLGIAGTIDCIARIKDEIVLIDWKTSRRYSITNGWQIAAYRLLAIEQKLVADCGLMGVQIPRDTATIKSFKYQHLDYVEHAFLCALEVFKALHYRKLEKLNWKWLNVRAI